MATASRVSNGNAFLPKARACILRQIAAYIVALFGFASQLVAQETNSIPAAHAAETKSSETQDAIEQKFARLNAALDKDDDATALRLIEELLRSLPVDDHGQLLTTKLSLNLRADEQADAVMLLNEIAENYADAPKVLNEVAWRVVESQQAGNNVSEKLLSNTIRVAERAVAGSINDAAILDTLANLVTISGDLKRAIEIQQQAVTACDDPKLKWRLEDTLRKWQLDDTLTSEQVQALDDSRQLHAQGMSAYQKTDFETSLESWERGCRVLAENRLKRHPDYAASLNNLANLHVSMGEYTSALTLYEQALQIAKQVLSEHHPKYAQYLRNLAYLHRIMDEYTSARPLLEQALQINKHTLGEQHPEYAKSLNDLALLHKSMGEYTSALPLYEQALQIDKQVLGEQDPEYAIRLSNLAVLHRSMGDYAAALPLLEQALEISEQVPGEKSLNLITSLNNLALLRKSMGDYATALSLYERAFMINRQALGQDSRFALFHATSLNNLAALHDLMGNYAAALTLFEQALQIRKQLLGEQHTDYAESLQNLAKMRGKIGDYASAMPLLERALLINKQVLGEQHPSYATSLCNLASVYRSMEDDPSASRAYEQALEIFKQKLGERSPDYAICLDNLADLRCRMGDYAAALPLLEQSLKLLNEVLDEQHPDYAASLNNLARLHRSMGDYATALPLYRQANDIVLDNLTKTSIVQSERQQKKLLGEKRLYLDFAISNLFEIARQPDSYLEVAWKWKGSVTLRQQAYRRVADEPELKPMFDELRSVSARLSAMSGRVPLPPPLAAKEVEKSNYKVKRQNWERQFKELSAHREELEADIASKSEVFRNATEPLKVAEVRELLPSNSVFVDFLEYDHYAPSPDKPGKFLGQTRYLAFFVPKQGPVSMLQLGSAQRIKQKISRFRQQFQPNANQKEIAAAAEAAKSLRKLIWEPIAAKLTSEDTIIISPDTEISALPFAVLPGDKPGSYLIEDYKFSVLPLAGMLRSLTEETKALPQSDKDLLVVGDVDYSRAESTPTESSRQSDQDWLVALRSSVGTFKKLAYAKTELDSIANLFKQEFDESNEGSLLVLRGRAATEAEFMRLAPRHRNLHVITHGFFVPPEYDTVPVDRSFGPDSVQTSFSARSELGRTVQVERYLPNLLTGLAMAGANEPPTDKTPEDDGILTAAEIESLYLESVDLVVLSACETGLGKSVQGEGLTGLQRAFHLAGAKSVVASLWQVPDKATNELMRRFYTYYWHDGLPKIDALRQAQLDILSNPQLTDGSDGRGLGAQQTTAKSDKPSAPDAPTRTSPLYWAAFQLSGDWR